MGSDDLTIPLHLVLHVKFKLLEVLWLVLLLQRHHVLEHDAFGGLVFDDLFEDFLRLMDGNALLFLHLEQLLLSRRLHLFDVKVLGTNLEPHHLVECLLGLAFVLELDVGAAGESLIIID